MRMTVLTLRKVLNIHLSARSPLGIDVNVTNLESLEIIRSEITNISRMFIARMFDTARLCKNFE